MINESISDGALYCQSIHSMLQLHVDIEGPTETILELLVRQYSVIIVVNFLDPFIYFFKPEPVFD